METSSFFIHTHYILMVTRGVQVKITRGPDAHSCVPERLGNLCMV